MSRSAPTVLLLLGTVMVCGLCLLRISVLNTLSHDDGISYLAATGHQGRYATSIPAQRWVPARAWKAYWTPDEFGCFGRIGSDLGQYDIHPPLYFWLLHIWTYVFGVTLASGPALNAIIVILTIGAIFKVCLLLGISRLSAAVAAIAWGLSGSTLEAALPVRPYALLGLVVVVFIGAMLSFRVQAFDCALVWVSLSALAGFLTHYHFSLVLGFTTVAIVASFLRSPQLRLADYGVLGFAPAAFGAGILYLVVRWMTGLIDLGYHPYVWLILLGSCALAAAIAFLSARRWGPVLTTVAAVSAAVLGGVALHPLLLRSLVTLQAQVEPFAWGEIGPRLAECARALLGLVVPDSLAEPIAQPLVQHWEVVLPLGAAAGFAVVWLARGTWARSFTRGLDAPSIPLLVSAATLTSVWLLYVLCFSPRHAMGPRYIMVASPQLFICVAQLVDRLRRFPHVWQATLLVVLVWQGVYGAYSTMRFVQAQRWQRAHTLAMNGTPVVLDSTERGIVPGILWQVDDATRVYAASQDQLLARFPLLATETQIIYASDPSVYGSSVKRDRVLDRFRALGFRSVTAEGAIFPKGAIYRVSRDRD